MIAIINPNFFYARNFAVPARESCMLARAKKLSTNTTKVKPLSEKEGALSRHKIEVGGFVSTDKFVCKTPGHLPTVYGRE